MAAAALEVGIAMPHIHVVYSVLNASGRHEKYYIVMRLLPSGLVGCASISRFVSFDVAWGGRPVLTNLTPADAVLASGALPEALRARVRRLGRQCSRPARGFGVAVWARPWDAGW